MNCKDEKQHYVSRVLLKRFKSKGSPFQCFEVQTGRWNQRSIDSVCSANGYNQLLSSGEVNNAIEDSFSKVESALPKTFKALERAANLPSTKLPQEIYENMCLYCTFLKQISPFSKPAAVVSFLVQINMELEKGEYYLLRELKVPDEVVTRFRDGYSQGGRVIVESENILQLIHRFQFDWLFEMNYSIFLNCNWTISHSPVELPMSDIGLIPLQLNELKANQYFLPIGPNLMLEGLSYFDQTKNSSKPFVFGHTLTAEEAEYRLDAISLSAVKELIFAHRNLEIVANLNRARLKRIAFHEIVNLELATTAGLKNSSNNYQLRMVSTEEYKKFIHSYIKPPNLGN